MQGRGKKKKKTENENENENEIKSPYSDGVAVNEKTKLNCVREDLLF